MQVDLIRSGCFGTISNFDVVGIEFTMPHIIPHSLDLFPSSHRRHTARAVLQRHANGHVFLGLSLWALSCALTQV